MSISKFVLAVIADPILRDADLGEAPACLEVFLSYSDIQPVSVTKCRWVEHVWTWKRNSGIMSLEMFLEATWLCVKLRERERESAKGDKIKIEVWSTSLTWSQVWEIIYEDVNLYYQIL